MPFKTLLSVTRPELGESDLKVAADLCEQIDTHLSVLVMALGTPPPIGEYAAMVEERHDDLKKLGHRTTAAVSKFLAARTLSSDLSEEYQEAAWADEIIGHRARYADLTVIGPEVLPPGCSRRGCSKGRCFPRANPCSWSLTAAGLP